MQDDLFRLIDILTAAWTRCLPHPWGPGVFTPTANITFCNEYVASVNRVFGNVEFYTAAGRTLLANEIVDLMLAHPERYQPVSGSAAQFAANTGKLVIAGWKNPEPLQHGHVSIVFPGTLGASANWQSNQVPRLANVGVDKYCRIGMGANWCFSKEPTYFVFTQPS